MKTSHLTRLCWTILTSLVAMSGFSQVTKQQAIDFVMDSIVGSQADSMNVYMESSVQSKPYCILSPYDSIEAPCSDYWLFFIDEQPEYAWAHRCEYVFIDTISGAHLELY